MSKRSHDDIDSGVGEGSARSSDGSRAGCDGNGEGRAEREAKRERLEDGADDGRAQSASLERKYIPAIGGCRRMDEAYEMMNRIEEGAYGEVFRARDRRTNIAVALKRLKMEKQRDGFPITSLREISTLMRVPHANIVAVYEIVVGQSLGDIFIVFEFVAHDLRALVETMQRPLSTGEIKCLMIQLLRAMDHMHSNWVIHRDLKPANLLLSDDGVLKVADFGLAREYGSPLHDMTQLVVTLWYRAPELLLGTKTYSTGIDMWSVGGIFAELMLGKPLWPAQGELEMINMVFKELGTPSEKIWKGWSELPHVKRCTFKQYPYSQLHNRFPDLPQPGLHLLNALLTYDPEHRITAADALKHPYFLTPPRPLEPADFPTFPARSRGESRTTTARPPPAPVNHDAEAHARDQRVDDNDDNDDAGFHVVDSHGTMLMEGGGGFRLK